MELPCLPKDYRSMVSLKAAGSHAWSLKSQAETVMKPRQNWTISVSPVSRADESRDSCGMAGAGRVSSCRCCKILSLPSVLAPDLRHRFASLSRGLLRVGFSIWWRDLVKNFYTNHPSVINKTALKLFKLDATALDAYKPTAQNHNPQTPPPQPNGWLLLLL